MTLIVFYLQMQISFCRIKIQSWFQREKINKVKTKSQHKKAKKLCQTDTCSGPTSSCSRSQCPYKFTPFRVKITNLSLCCSFMSKCVSVGHHYSYTIHLTPTKALTKMELVQSFNHSISMLFSHYYSSLMYTGTDFSLNPFSYVGFLVLCTWFCHLCCLSHGCARNSRWGIVKVQMRSLRTEGVCAINRL